MISVLVELRFPISGPEWASVNADGCCKQEVLERNSVKRLSKLFRVPAGLGCDGPIHIDGIAMVEQIFDHLVLTLDRPCIDLGHDDRAEQRRCTAL